MFYSATFGADRTFKREDALALGRAAFSAFCTWADRCTEASFMCPLLPQVHSHPGLPSGHSSSRLHNSPLGRLTGLYTHNGQNCSPLLPLNLNSSLLHLAKCMTIHPSPKPVPLPSLLASITSFQILLLISHKYRNSDSFLLPALPTP